MYYFNVIEVIVYLFKLFQSFDIMNIVVSKQYLLKKTNTGIKQLKRTIF